MSQSTTILIHLFDDEKITKIAEISIEKLQEYQEKIIPFLLDKYTPTAFQLRIKNDPSKEYPMCYFGKLSESETTGKPIVLNGDKETPLKKMDFVFDTETNACIYGATRLVSLSNHLPKSLLKGVNVKSRS